VKGLLLSVTKSPAAMRDDCAAASIAILKLPRPKGCNPPGIAIDVDALTAKGAHAIHVDGARISVQTVADTRGTRPWSAQLAKDDVNAPELAEDAPVSRGGRNP
jgi:competence protein ComEC